MTSAVSSPIAIRNPRLVAFDQLLQQLGHGRQVWSGFLDRLPLTLGESAVDRVVPYSVSDDIQQAFVAGVDGLVDLLKRRRDPAYDREKQTALLPDERQRVVLWPRRICPRTLPEDDPLRQAIRSALLRTPELDGGLLESWLSRGAGGRELYEALTGLLAKALHTALHQPAYSGVGLMAHLAAFNSLLAVKERTKQAKVKNLTYARFERAVGMALHACFRQAFDSALIEVGRPPLGTPEHTDLMVCLVSLGPRAFVAIRSEELHEDLNPYGLSQELDQLLAPLFQSELERGNLPHSLLSGMLASLSRPGPLRTSVLQHAGCEGLRRLALDHLLAAEDPALETDRLLGYCFPSNTGLLDLMDNGALLGQMAADLSNRLTDRRRREGSWREIQRLLGFLEGLRDHGPPWKQPAAQDDLLLRDQLERFLLSRMDEFASSRLQHARRRVIDRRLTSTSAALRQEYEGGRLYRVSTDELPLVRARLAHEEAQLFVDLKGYTRRTAIAKELVMAEFLKSEFYEPILDAAKRYHGGADLIGREHNIQLVNLLGDAVAFSGNIVSLVRLARDIQDIFRAYRQRLLALSPDGEQSSDLSGRGRNAERHLAIRDEIDKLGNQLAVVQKDIFQRSGQSCAEMVKQLQQDFRDQFEQIQRSYRSLQQQERSQTDPTRRAQLAARVEATQHAYAQLKAQRAQSLQQLKSLQGEALTELLTDLNTKRLLEQVRRIESSIQALQDEDHTLSEAEREDQYRQGAGLEAGLFISYGAAAEVLSMDDDVWGMQRVAVSERINEAARGTARNLAVRQQLDEALEAARFRMGNPSLELPYRVYIASTGSVRMDPQLGRMLQRAMVERDQELLDRSLDQLDRSVRARFAGSSGVDAAAAAIQANDIYNLGEAISAGALDGYLRQTRASHMFFRIQIRPEELEASIQQRFLFVEDMLDLIVGYEVKRDTPELEMFRYVGQVLFRGFEGTRPTPVYEILRPDSPFVRMLGQHHSADWLAEAQQDPACKLEGLFQADCSEPAAEP
jgi:hypothetical protein